ncbi:MAG: hypothetical protein JWN62_60 [Acidimicrobiales bacterium]|nr:hypothetical protein [Acidimicrobiales bacterium]
MTVSAHQGRVSELAVDEWGRDARLIDLLSPIARMRWDVIFADEIRLPTGPALVVVNTRRFALTPIAVAWALGDELERPVRFVGRPDIVPFGPLLRRAGGLLDRADEVAGALRDGALVLVGAGPRLGAEHVGAIEPDVIGAALREGAPIHVAAVRSSATSRHIGVEIDHPLRPRRRRRGPLAEVELADAAQTRLRDLLRGTSGGVADLAAARAAMRGSA